MTHEIFSADQEFGFAVSKGVITGLSRFNMTAIKNNPTSDTERDMVQFADDYVFPDSSGEEMEMVATEAGRNILIKGLDADGKEKEETRVSIDGTLAIGIWSAINRVTNNGPEGLSAVLTIKKVGAATIYAQIEIGFNRTFMGVHVVPSNKEAFVSELIISMQKAVGVDVGGTIRVKSTPPGANHRICQFASQLQKEGNTSLSFFNRYPEIAPPRTKLILTVEATAASADFLARAAILYSEVTIP